MPLYHLDPTDPAVVRCARCGWAVGNLPRLARCAAPPEQQAGLAAGQAARVWPELAAVVAEHDALCGGREEAVYVQTEAGDAAPSGGGAYGDIPPWLRPGVDVSGEARLLARLASLALGGATGAGMVAVVLTLSEVPAAGRPEAWAALVMAGLLLAFGLTLVVHEGGHFLAGWAAGLPLQAALIGPAVFRRASGRWHLAWDWRLSRNLKRTPLGAVYAGWGGAGRWRWAVFIFGGPLANLASGAAGAALFFAPLPPPVRCWAGLYAVSSLGTGAANLLPLRYGQLASDGLVLWSLFAVRDLAGGRVGGAMKADVPHDERENARPWEAPGAVRRDVAPHRGHWLVPLGTAALVLGAFALCFGLTGLLGLPLAVLTLRLAGRDLGRMRAGRLDPAGRASAERALRLAWPAAALALLGLSLWGWAFATAPRF